MSVLVFLRMFCDITLFYALLSGLPVFFPHEMAFFLPAILCSVGAGIGSALYGRGRLRFLGILLPLASLALAGNVVEILLLIPPIIYAAVTIFRGPPDMDYYPFRQRFLNYIKGLVVYSFAIAVFGELQKTMPGEYVLFNVGEVLRYGIVCILTGVLLLRQVRMGAESFAHEKALGSVQLAVTLLIAGIVIVVIMSVEWIASWLMVNVFARGIAYLGMPFVWFFSRKEEPQEIEPSPSVSPVDTPQPSLNPLPTPVEGTPEPVDIPAATGMSYWVYILMVTVLVAAAAVMLFAWHQRRSKRVVSRTAETVGKTEPTPHLSARAALSNRNRLRMYYRSFLKTEQARGLKRRRSQTSADILAGLSERANHNAAAELRELYLAARYDETRDVTNEQVKAAKNALKKNASGS